MAARRRRRSTRKRLRHGSLRPVAIGQSALLPLVLRSHYRIKRAAIAQPLLLTILVLRSHDGIKRQQLHRQSINPYYLLFWYCDPMTGSSGSNCTEARTSSTSDPDKRELSPTEKEGTPAIAGRGRGAGGRDRSRRRIGFLAEGPRRKRAHPKKTAPSKVGCRI